MLYISVEKWIRGPYFNNPYWVLPLRLQVMPTNFFLHRYTKDQEYCIFKIWCGEDRHNGNYVEGTTPQTSNNGFNGCE
jgi:hypothetical protein